MVTRIKQACFFEEWVGFGELTDKSGAGICWVESEKWQDLNQLVQCSEWAVSPVSSVRINGFQDIHVALVS